MSPGGRKTCVLALISIRDSKSKQGVCKIFIKIVFFLGTLLINTSISSSFEIHLKHGFVLKGSILHYLGANQISTCKYLLLLN